MKKYYSVPIAALTVVGLGVGGFAVYANAEDSTGELGQKFVHQRAHERIPQELHEQIISAFEASDYSMFIAAHNEAGLELPEQMTEERFAEMVERFQSGEHARFGEQRQVRTEGAEKRGKFMGGMFGKNQEQLETILESQDFEAFKAFVAENASERRENDSFNESERLERLQEHFNQMVERFQERQS